MKQVPFEQNPVPLVELQTIPHALQLLGSHFRLTQVPLQLVSPVGQDTAQVPLEQTWPAGHVTPHDPQFELSVLRLTQVPLQFVRPL
jgi:hypothetical protein